MADFERHASPFDLSLAALGRTPATRDIYVGVLRRFDRFIAAVPVDQVVPGQLVEYQRHLASVGLSWSRFNIKPAPCARSTATTSAAGSGITRASRSRSADTGFRRSRPLRKWQPCSRLPPPPSTARSS